MDLIQANGQPRYGRFNALPQSINIDQFIFKTPHGKTLKGWRKQLKFKKFKFCSIQHQHYSIGLAIADIAWAGHGLVYIYDHREQQVMQWNSLQILARNTTVDEQPYYNQSYLTKSPFHLHIQHANGVRYLQVTKHDEIKLQARIFCAGTDALSMCSPTGVNGWTYTQKLGSLAVEGFFVNREQQHISFDAKTLAALDDTCGFLVPESAWHWLSFNFWDVDGTRIGLNLASKVNQDYGNENALWVNGVLYPISDVLFVQLGQNCWSVRSQDLSLDLELTTGWRHYENINLRLVGSQFSQWQSRVSGTIHCAGLNKRIMLDQEYALLKRYNVKW